MKFIFIFIFILTTVSFWAISQTTPSYTDSINTFRKEYISTHEVITDSARRRLFSFFKPDSRYRINATFTKSPDTSAIEMATYSKKKKAFLVYGYADFELNGRSLRVYLYQYRKLMNDPTHKDDLFLPFTDKTSGKKSYVCRYLDLKIGDIQNDRIIIDFNKCYNPYCAYKDGFNCPVPPRENRLPIAIRAGEQAFPHDQRLPAGATN